MEKNHAWAAGLFEGEGTIVAFGPRKNQRSFSLTSTDEDVVRRFADIIATGKVYGPYTYKGTDQRKRDHHKPYWRWSASDRVSVLAAAAILLPWMCERRRQKMEEAVHAVQLLQDRHGWRNGKPIDN